MPEEAFLPELMSDADAPAAVQAAAAVMSAADADMLQPVIWQAAAAGADAIMPPPAAMQPPPAGPELHMQQVAPEQPDDEEWQAHMREVLQLAAAEPMLKAAEARDSMYAEVERTLERCGISAVQLLQAKQAGDVAAAHKPQAPAAPAAGALAVAGGQVVKKKGRPKKNDVSARFACSSFACTVLCTLLLCG